MPTRTAASKPTIQSQAAAVRAERYRVRFDTPAQAAMCAQIAGACRYVWNFMLADCQFRYARWVEMHAPACHWPEVKNGSTEWGRAFRKRMGPKPSVSAFTLFKRFTALRNDPEHAWLKELPYACVRYSLKYMADAYQRFFRDPVNEGPPRFKSRARTTDGFTIPDRVRMDGTRLHIPKVGWVRLSGSGLYLGCKPKQVRILKEGSEAHPKWYAYVFHEVPADRLPPPAETGALGVDRNVGQATDSDGDVYETPDDPQLEAHIRRKQRELSRKQGWGPKDRRPKSNRGRRINGQLRKLQRKKKRRRENAAHQHSRKMANTAHTVVIEDLNTKGMTASARGTVEKPGTNVKQKAGLNREILASNWGRLERNLGYKAGQVVKVNSAHTSQTCSVCGHVNKENRRTQALFHCTACGHTANADHNAAVNILARGLPLVRPARGVGAAARREAIPLGTSTTREQGRPGSPVPAGAGSQLSNPLSMVNSSI